MRRPATPANWLSVAAAIGLTLAVPASVVAQTTRVQSVQLPTFHYFGVQTTVVVGDRGRVSLGGVQRFASRPTQFDKVGNRATNFGTGAAGLAIEATVIDLSAMDRALLAEAARRRGAKVDVLGRPVAQPISDAASRQRAVNLWQRGQKKVAR